MRLDPAGDVAAFSFGFEGGIMRATTPAGSLSTKLRGCLQECARQLWFLRRRLEARDLKPHQEVAIGQERFVFHQESVSRGSLFGVEAIAESGGDRHYPAVPGVLDEIAIELEDGGGLRSLRRIRSHHDARGVFGLQALVVLPR